MEEGIRVLYVDDESDLLEIARLFLEKTGNFQVFTSTSAKDALDSPSIRSYDLIVSDYQMPDMDGIAFLKEVRKRYGDLPFILFTGKGREEVVIEAINNGADFYLQKGGDPAAQFAELAHKIRQAVARKKSQDELRAAYEQISAAEEELRGQYEELAFAQAKILESQQQLAGITGSVPGVVYQSCTRPDGSMEASFVSSRAPEVFGISNDPEGFVGRFTAQVDPRDRDAFLRSIKEVISSGSSWDFEGRFIKPGGEVIWFQGLSRPVKKGSGIVYNGVLLDITDRKRAEEELRENERKLREAQEMAHLGFWSWDVKTGHVEWSDEVFRIFGLDPGGFTPRIDSIIELSPWPEERQRDRELIRKAIESRKPGMFEQRFLRPDKSIGYSCSTFQGRYDQSGNLIAIIGTVLDITGQKQAQEKLQESEERSRRILEEAPLPLALVRNDGVVTFVNDRFVKVFGYTPEDIPTLEAWWQRAYPDPDYRQRVIQQWDEAVRRAGEEQSDIAPAEYRVTCRNGEERIIEISGITLNDGVLATFIDHTERKRAEEALEKRLVALTRPLEDTGVAFEDLFDLNEIQQLQDEFAKATGVAVLLTRPDGTPITRPSNFCRLCSEIVRRTPAGRERCYKSDSELGKVHEGGPYIHVCLSAGLWGAGTNIVLGGRHIANWLIGQVRNETQTEEHMRAYAREIGVNEEDFIKAFYEVPVMSSERFSSVAQSLSTLANQLSKIAYQNVQQARFIAERRSFEDALREKTEELDQFFTASLDLFCIAGTDGYFRRLNKEWEKALGYTLADLEGHRFLDFVHPDDQIPTLAAVADLAGQKQVLNFTNRYRHKDGSYRWIEWRSFPIGDRIFAAARDITERKRMEEALRESEELLRLFIEHAPAALAMLDKELRYIAASRRWMTDYHLGDRDLRGHSHYEIFPELTEEIKDVLRRGLAGEITSANEDKFERQDGSVQWLAWEVRPWYTAGHDIGGVIIFSEDITRRKRAEETLRESEARLASILHGSPVLQFVIDHDHRILSWNKALEEYSGIPAADIIGTDQQWRAFYPHKRPVLADLLVDNNTDGLFKWYAGKLQPSRYIDGAYEATDFFPAMGASGTWLSFTAAPLWNADGVLIGAVETLEDVTERKAMEHAIREANRKLGLLNSITRHDVVNQLTALQGFTRIAAMEERDPVIAGYLGKIDAGSATIRRQIEFMKTYQELGVHTPGWFRLDETIAKAARNEVACSGTCRGIEVFADPMLEKVFFNLFENAMRHGKRVTEIGVRCEPAPDGLVIMVEDNGTGIPAGEKERIFEKGYGENSGFGLFLAREILSITGITIRESGEPGRGARFEMTVPKEAWRNSRESTG